MADPAPLLVLVEDSMADVGLVREALEEYQIECDLIVISNGERAIRFIDDIGAGLEPAPKLMILDLNLPKRSGREVLAQLRSISGGAGIPAVILTSSDSQKDKDAVARLRPTKYICKPSRLDQFIQLGAEFKRLLAGSGT